MARPRQHSLGLAPTDPPSGLGATTTWLTPKFIIDALGPFDLDPCAAPSPRPWPTAAVHIELPQNGLALQWSGLIWLNPPYSRTIADWTDRLIEHGVGIALVFARTDAAWWQRAARAADVVRFLPKRIRFCSRDGAPAKGRPAIPSCLLGFGDLAATRLMDAQKTLGGLELYP